MSLATKKQFKSIKALCLKSKVLFSFPYDLYSLTALFPRPLSLNIYINILYQLSNTLHKAKEIFLPQADDLRFPRLSLGYSFLPPCPCRRGQKLLYFSGRRGLFDYNMFVIRQTEFRPKVQKLLLSEDGLIRGKDTLYFAGCLFCFVLTKHP